MVLDAHNGWLAGTCCRRLLLVEDDPGAAERIAAQLLEVREDVPALTVAGTLAAAGERLGSDAYAAVLLDLGLPDSRGLETLDRVVARAGTVPVIVLTEALDEERGVEALARGAADFVPKAELTGRLLLRSVRYAVERSRRHGIEARYRALVENSRDLITILDRDLSMRYVSPSVRRILGHDPVEKQGSDAVLEVHPDDRPRVRQEVGRGLEDPEHTTHVQYRVRHRDGSWRVLDTIGRNCFGDPHIGGFVLHSRDVTEQRELEEQLRQSQRMEAIGRLAGGIAHDFNNLITVVESSADLLLEELPWGEGARRDLEGIRDAGARAADLTRQLLAFSREQVLRERRLDLRDVVAGLERLLRRLVPERIVLETDVSPEPAVVEADLSQLQQVVINLVANAADAIAGTGTIRVVVRRTELAPAETREYPWHVEPGPYVELRVEDTGEGMVPEVLSHVFEPFFTTKEEGRGTGLGLATVYGVVKQSRGHILADSRPGEGAVFRVLLPRLAGEPDRAAEASADPTSVGPAVVLLVEDDTAVRSVARRILERGGHTVLEAANGREALALDAGGIDLVISDVVMPDMGGVELHGRLAARHPELKVVLTSGYSEAEVRAEIRQLGTAFLPKPYTPQALLRCVADVLADEPGRNGGPVQAGPAAARRL